MVNRAGHAAAETALPAELDGPSVTPQPKLQLLHGGKDQPPADFTFIDLFAGIGGLRRGFFMLHLRLLGGSNYR